MIEMFQLDLLVIDWLYYIWGQVFHYLDFTDIIKMSKLLFFLLYVFTELYHITPNNKIILVHLHMPQIGPRWDMLPLRLNHLDKILYLWILYIYHSLVCFKPSNLFCFVLGLDSMNIPKKNELSNCYVVDKGYLFLNPCLCYCLMYPVYFNNSDLSHYNNTALIYFFSKGCIIMFGITIFIAMICIWIYNNYWKLRMCVRIPT